MSEPKRASRKVKPSSGSNHKKKPSSGASRSKTILGSDSVKVAVRVRPFSQREKGKGAKLCVQMDGNTTTVRDVTKQKPNRTFTFDFSYWSHDGFEEDENGVLVRRHLARNVDRIFFSPVATSAAYASQQRVFDDVGVGMLDNALNGYNAALFAYGQTGSGKSYSITGYGANKGIVPIMCTKVFERAASMNKTTTEFQVTFSMLEIYNERVRDLLSAGKGKAGSGLKVRQHAKSGFVVYGLNKVAVNTPEHILERIEAGNVARTTAATKMNETSSRSHMVITLQIKQVFNKGTPESTTKMSDLHLVDLAGSERADTSGTAGCMDRLQEGSAINQSLSCLGNVISALADLSAGKNVRVPYRDSVLTKLLQNALGGNSRTVMMTAISPASIHYEETVSSLRYADRAKQIKCKAVVNESPTDKLIRELREENERLLKMINRGGGGDGGGGGSGSGMDAELEVNQSILREMESTWAEKLKAAEAQWKSHVPTAKADLNDIYLENINEDPQLSGVLNHTVEEGKTLVTRQTKGGNARRPSRIDHVIALGGLRIQPKHAILVRKEGKVRLEPGEQKSEVLVNGRRLLKATTLQHSDRIHLAPNHIYKFVALPKDRKPEPQPIDFDFVLNEIAAAQGLGFVGGEGTSTSLNADALLVKEDVVSLLPMIQEANAISAELQKPIVFDLLVKSGTSHNLTDKSKQVMVKVTNTSSQHVWLWEKAKFISRKFLMQGLYELWVDGSPIDPDKHKDPFWDPPEDFFLGSVYLYLQSLAYTIDIDETLSITNYQGADEGKLHVSLCPCDATGRDINEEMFVSTPEELVGRRMDMLVKIPWAQDIKWIQEDPTRGISCRFKFYTDTKMRCTKTMTAAISPQIEYTKQFTIKSVSNNFVNYLEHNALVVEVWGTQGTGQPMAISPMPGTAAWDEATMNGITQEANWLKEKAYLTEKCSELQAEVDFLKIEKFALEKEMTKITIGGDTFVQKKDPGMEEGIEVTFQAFMQEDQILRDRLTELKRGRGDEDPEPVSKQEINSLKSVITFQQGKVKELTKMLNDTIDGAKKVTAQLAKK